MEHDRGAAGMEDRVGLALVERDRGVDHLHLELAVLRDVQVRHVAGMAAARQEAVLVVGGIEMRPRRLEGRLALADGMDVEGVIACGRTLERKLDQHAIGRISSAVPTSLPLLSLSAALADCAAAGKARAVVSSSAALPAPRHFNIDMTDSP